MKASLQAFAREHGYESGRKAFLYYLHKTCAPQDSESQHEASTKFYAIRITDDEHLQNLIIASILKSNLFTLRVLSWNHVQSLTNICGLFNQYRIRSFRS